MIEDGNYDTGDTLSTVTEDGQRVYLHPATVSGRFHRRRNVVQAVLIGFYLILPWIKIGGRPVLLLDVAHREFSVFGLYFRAHDVPLLLFPVLGFTLFVALVTALFGRVWCGWACPQTVFIEAVFRRLEAFVEGGPLRRRQLDREPMSASKFARRLVKWFLFLLVSLAVTHSALALFVGRERLWQAVHQSPLENWPAFLFIAFSTAVILFDFGWLREQFCLLACPYGRIQSLLVDKDTRTILYDERRGEPRRGYSSELPAGDCVNCLRCVQVCPTGIDIRRGANQLECIGCTACIDACDEVMEKIQKPKGLIRYDSLSAVNREASPWLRPRIVLYGALLAGLLAAFGFTLRNRKPLELAILKTAGDPFESVAGPDGSSWIANAYHAEVSNLTGCEASVDIALAGEARGMKLIVPGNPFVLHSGEIRQIPFLVESAKENFRDGTFKAVLRISLRVAGSKEEIETKEVTLAGPFH